MSCFFSFVIYIRRDHFYSGRIELPNLSLLERNSHSLGGNSMIMMACGNEYECSYEVGGNEQSLSCVNFVTEWNKWVVIGRFTVKE